MDPASAEEQAFSGYISEYSSLLAPIRRLPHDILEMIFLQQPIHMYISLSQLQPSLVVNELNTHLLASVSHHWRSTSLDCPRMWSAFEINAYGGKSTLTRLRLCIERSREATLTILLNLSTGSTLGMEPTPNMDILNELMKIPKRWGLLSIAVQSWAQMELLAPVRGHLHSLRHLQLSFGGGISVQPPAVPLFENTPRLYTLRLGSPRDLRGLSIPVHQIQRLSLYSSDVEACSHTLSMFPNIRDLDISKCGLNLAAPPVEPHLRTSITRITLAGTLAGIPQVEANMMGVFRCVTTPNLGQLHIVRCAQWDTPSVMPFLTRSAAPLKELVLAYVGIGAEELLAFLRETPKLEFLRLTRLPPDSITDSLVDTLTPSSGKLLLVRLKHIEIVGVYSVSTDRLLRILENRVTSLVFVRLTLRDRQVSTADRARFTALQALPMFLRLEFLNETREVD
ncbi:hypothetical protein B0H16DRAFT_1838164 [Mycena metata]|uniref:F-box domain-containing protein n=1 Tax=Mycena metata TaxID=1033252 RepID=A0AAD7NXF5_9AGAR|nr:hypothetical protein B0H16DRAFT_1838164 [Mycena metata]